MEEPKSLGNVANDLHNDLSSSVECLVPQKIVSVQIREPRKVRANMTRRRMIHADWI